MINITIWLIFCGAMELLVYVISDYYDYNYLPLELVKCVLIVLSFAFLNTFMQIRRWEKDIKMKMNMCISTIVSSISGAVSVTLFLKSKGHVAWIIFLLIYLGTIACMLWWGKKIVFVDDVADIEKEKAKRPFILGISGGFIMATLGFVRTASDNTIMIFFEISALILIWLCLFIGILCIARCRYDFNKKELQQRKEEI